MMWIKRLSVRAKLGDLGSHMMSSFTRRRQPYRRVWAAAISAKWAARMREVKNWRSVILGLFLRDQLLDLFMTHSCQE